MCSEQGSEATQEEIQFPEDDENANQEVIEFAEGENAGGDEDNDAAAVAEFIEEAAGLGDEGATDDNEPSADEAMDDGEPSADEDFNE